MTDRRSWCLIVPILLVSLVATPRAEAKDEKPTKAQTKGYTLPQLVSLARKHYPGVEAARQAVGIMEGKVFQAKWAWIPQGTVKGFVAPSSDIKCEGLELPSVNMTNAERARLKGLCIGTNNNPTSNVSDISWTGLFGRIDAEFGMPIYTFDKIGSARRAADAGLEANRAQVSASVDKITSDVTKAYWGLKLAQEILYTIKEGRKHLDKAITRVEQELDEGKGESTETDLLRLKVARVEVESQTHEARKGQVLALATLKLLTGQGGKRDFGVDDAVLELKEGKLGQAGRYVGLAHKHRPEVRMLDAAVKARQAKVALEKARFWPDLLLVGMLGIARAMGVDDPNHAFLSDPFNYTGAGFGLVMSWKWDQVQQYGRYKVAKAEALETRSKRREALLGIELEVRKTALDLDEAGKRLDTLKKGQKAARSWLVATSQNLSLGTSEPKDLTDALVAFFSLKLKYLKAIYDVNTGWAELVRVLGTSPTK
jgi:outer membrane protein TolC